MMSSKHSSTHFNPRSPHGERLARPRRLRPMGNFNPRSPHGERLFAQDVEFLDSAFQSTLPARGATRGRVRALPHFRISIHAPRTGSDDTSKGYVLIAIKFQSTLPARGATRMRALLRSGVQFQSTLPARGATGNTKLTVSPAKISIHAPRTGSDHACCQSPRETGYFNPRSPHGERLATRIPVDTHSIISIHAPRTGSDARRTRRSM